MVELTDTKYMTAEQKKDGTAAMGALSTWWAQSRRL